MYPVCIPKTKSVYPVPVYTLYLQVWYRGGQWSQSGFTVRHIPRALLRALDAIHTQRPMHRAGSAYCRTVRPLHRAHGVWGTEPRAPCTPGPNQTVHRRCTLPPIIHCTERPCSRDALGMDVRGLLSRSTGPSALSPWTLTPLTGLRFPCDTPRE